MPARICPLDPLHADRLRAYEIIPRPAAVAKELIENALDAGATRVAVDVSGGGLHELSVADDGCGMAADDVELAFQHFTSSKASPPPGAPAQLGFRGEALAAIAAVAQVCCLTRAPDAADATELRVAAGGVQYRGAGARASGTTVTARRLFSDDPARRAFLRGERAETAEIASVVAQYATTRPDVRFTLAVERRQRVATTGSGDLRLAIGEILDHATADALLDIAAAACAPAPDDGDARWVRVSGLVAPPHLSRAERSWAFLAVNGRPVRLDGAFAAVVNELYAPLLPPDRFPLVVIHLEAPPDAVDVSLHPTKQQVRLRDASFFARQVGVALHQALRHAVGPRALWAPEISPAACEAAAPGGERAPGSDR